jgi:DNA-directed RNA polymerase subunit RPC12/RpoP
MRVCPNCGKDVELYRELHNITIIEDITIHSVIDEVCVEYSVDTPDLIKDRGEITEDNIIYRCSYCRHVYEGKNVDSIYFNEMVERKEE